jgi:hypothetical protein
MIGVDSAQIGRCSNSPELAGWAGVWGLVWWWSVRGSASSAARVAGVVSVMVTQMVTWFLSLR